MAQILGPARMPAPSKGPGGGPATGANLAGETLEAIEAATSWRELAEVLRAAATWLNAVHVVRMVERLKVMVLEEDVEFESEEEVEELQALVSDLVRASRMFIDISYNVGQVASLLTTFVAFGVPPSENWLFASEIATLKEVDFVKDAEVRRLFITGTADWIVRHPVPVVQYQDNSWLFNCGVA